MKCGALPLTVTMPTTDLYIKQNVYTTVKKSHCSDAVSVNLTKATYSESKFG